MDLWLRLDLITTTCKHLLLLLSQLSWCHLLDIWLLAELELWILAHLNKGKSLINFTIAPDVSIWAKYILLHDRLSILLHHTIRLGSPPILVFALASGLLVMYTSHFNLVLLRLLLWSSPVVKFSSILNHS